jgi:ectoine hydroxylase-related dioxygenase (phytanoyl-CoA dioxygenase family)
MTDYKKKKGMNIKSDFIMSIPEYEFERYIASKDNVLTVLNNFGVAIIPNILNEEECCEMNNGMWNTLETLTQDWEKPINRNNSETWREMSKLYPKHSMLIQNWSIGHAQYIWNIRQNPKVVEIFSKVWQCEKEDLLVSFDAASYHMPPETTKLGWYRGRDWYHSDQSFINSDFKCVQGWVTGYDVNEGDATLSILESSHDYHKDFHEHFGVNEKDDWYKLNEEELEYYIEKKTCLPKRIRCPKGSLVLWDSRTIHCGSEALKTRAAPNFRNVAYVCYEPRERCSEKNLIKKQKAFNEMRMTSHWPCKIKLFPKNPRTYGGPIYEVKQLPRPVLTELGKKLAGF